MECVKTFRAQGPPKAEKHLRSAPEAQWGLSPHLGIFSAAGLDVLPRVLLNLRLAPKVQLLSQRAEDWKARMDLLIIVWAVMVFVGLPFVCIASAFVVMLVSERLGRLCVDLCHGLRVYLTSHHRRRPA